MRWFVLAFASKETAARVSENLLKKKTIIVSLILIKSRQGSKTWIYHTPI